MGGSCVGAWRAGDSSALTLIPLSLQMMEAAEEVLAELLSIYALGSLNQVEHLAQAERAAERIQQSDACIGDGTRRCLLAFGSSPTMSE